MKGGPMWPCKCECGCAELTALTHEVEAFDWHWTAGDGGGVRVLCRDTEKSPITVAYCFHCLLGLHKSGRLHAFTMTNDGQVFVTGSDLHPLQREFNYSENYSEVADCSEED